MTDFGTILITIFENFTNLMPRRTITEWEGGFKTRQGKITKKRFWAYGVVAEGEEDERIWRHGPHHYVLGGLVKLFGGDVESVKRENLHTGAYWFLPVFEEIHIETTTDRIADTERQDITTKNGRAVSVKTTTVYSIEDVAAYYRNLQYHGPSILNLIERATDVVVASRDYDKLCEQRVRRQGEESSELERSLIEEIKRNSEGYGINPKSTGLTQFTSVETFRFIGNDSNGIQLY